MTNDSVLQEWGKRKELIEKAKNFQTRDWQINDH